MKILYDHQIFLDQTYGGPSRYFYNIAKEIVKKENILINAPLHINKYLNYLPEEIVYGKNINSLFSKKIPYKLQIVIKKYIINKINIFFLNRKTKDFKPNLIHKTYFDNYKTNLPVVLTVYDLIHEKFHDLYGKKSDFRPKKFAIESADEIICISQNTLKDLDYYYNLKNKKTSVIYLASDLKDFNQSKLKNPINSNYLLYVGKRSGYKNFNNFIKAYSLSEQLKKDFKVVCFGGGKFRKKEITMFNEFKINFDKIKYFEGNDLLLTNFYKNATALIYPSQYEGFGLPVLEAMSFNCPVICSNTSSLPEVGGDAVAYFSPNNIENIKSTICEIVYSEKNKNDLLVKGKKRYQMFNWKKCADETLNIYKKLI
tara:strand:+ start:663 stop:1775 length:1113 start_codon:yes stop_codon:yes gene_type:complete